MKHVKRWQAGLLRLMLLSGVVTCLGWACGFDASLREYLSVDFWLPFTKNSAQFERADVARVDAPFAGMTLDTGGGSLGRLRDAYRADLRAHEYAVRSGRARSIGDRGPARQIV